MRKGAQYGRMGMKMKMNQRKGSCFNPTYPSRKTDERYTVTMCLGACFQRREKEKTPQGSGKSLDSSSSLSRLDDEVHVRVD